MEKNVADRLSSLTNGMYKKSNLNGQRYSAMSQVSKFASLNTLFFYTCR